MDEEQDSQGQVVSPEAERLSEALASLTLTQKAAAEKLHFNEKYFSQVKTGKKPLTSSLAFRLEHVFGISSRWLLRGEGEMISDPSKAAVYLKPERLPELAFHRRDAATGEWSRMTPFQEDLSHFVPLLEHTVGAQADLGQECAGRYVRTPLLVPPGEFYCLRVGPQYESLFRPDEFLLIQNFGSDQVRPEQVHRKICVLRQGVEAPWTLRHIEVVMEGQKTNAKVSPALSGDRSQAEGIAWEQLEIAGIVVMAFRTHFRKPESD